MRARKLKGQRTPFSCDLEADQQKVYRRVSPATCARGRDLHLLEQRTLTARVTMPTDDISATLSPLKADDMYPAWRMIDAMEKIGRMSPEGRPGGVSAGPPDHSAGKPAIRSAP